MSPQKQRSWRNLKFLTGKLALLALPFAAMLLIEAFVLPIDFFTLPLLEAMSVRSLKWAFPGPFYPNQSLARTEVGDLGNGTPYAVRRPVVWVTDDHGFRNRPNESAQSPDVVIIGDSFVAGAGLTQDEVLSEVLQRESGLASYSYAPSNMKHFLRDPRFAKQLPKVVVVAMSERSLSRMSAVSGSMSKTRQWLESLGPDFQGLIGPLDRLCAPCVLRFAQARLNPEPRKFIHFEEHPELLFMEAQKREDAVRPELRKRFVSLLRDYHHVITQRGSKFIFLPIPDKEFVYADALPSKHWPTMIPDLILDLKDAGVPVVEAQSEFVQARSENPDLPLYQPDDTHWGAPAVQIAAKLLNAEISLLNATETASAH